MANLPGTDNIPDIPVENWLPKLDEDIGKFLAAAKGEEVRGGFTDMANIIANVIHKQATYTTDDFSDSSTNAAAQAAALGNILFGGTDHTGKKPFVLSYWDHATIVTGDVTQFSVTDMPRNSFTSCVASKFAQKPSNVKDDSVIVIWRNAANSAGNVSELILFDRTQYRLYYSPHLEQYETVVWKEIATKDELVNYWEPPASGTQFSVSDMPRKSYTYTYAADFAQAPEGINSSSSIAIWREPVNSAGNISKITLFDRYTNKLFFSRYVETEGLADWEEIATASNTVQKSNVTITADNKTDYFTDANDAPNNSIFRILDTAEIKNTPWGNGFSTGAGNYDGTVRSVTGYISGTLLTYGSVDRYRNQIFISGNDISSNPSKISVMCFRSRFGPTAGWSDWHMLSDRAAITGSNVVIRKKLIAPYEDANGNPTATDTGIANHQRIVGDPFYFDDFNNAPLNSIIQVDLDCDATVMLNNPLSGKSNILMTWCWSYTRRHAVVQFCIGLSSGTSTEFYYRYGYANTATEYIWTPWESARATTDATLTKEGRAADAKEVGTRLAALEARIAALEN